MTNSDQVASPVAVAGCGAMGVGIAIAAARGGRRTILYDRDAAQPELARQEISRYFEGSVRRCKVTSDEAEEILHRLEIAKSIDALEGCDIVIEAVFEDLETKSALFRDLNAVCAASTVFATNTSTLSVTQLGAASGRPDRFVGLHFCLPAQVMKLVEVSPGLVTNKDTLARGLAFCQEIGQVPIETKDRPGFILNHFVIPLNNRAIRMVEMNIAAPEDIDRAMKTAMGFPIGPLELLDLVGLDTQERLCDAFYDITHDPELACPPLIRRMVAAGWLGKKTGRGFYLYDSSAAFGA